LVFLFVEPMIATKLWLQKKIDTLK